MLDQPATEAPLPLICASVTGSHLPHTRHMQSQLAIAHWSTALDMPRPSASYEQVMIQNCGFHDLHPGDRVEVDIINSHQGSLLT